MIKKQPEALRLAEILETGYNPTSQETKSAAELRRLHELNKDLLKAMYSVQEHIRFDQDLNAADSIICAAIAKVLGEVND